MLVYEFMLIPVKYIEAINYSGPFFPVKTLLSNIIQDYDFSPFNAIIGSLFDTSCL